MGFNYNCLKTNYELQSNIYHSDKKSIKTGLWIWKRWPVLKTLQIPLEGKMYTNLESFKFYHEVTVLLKQIDFVTCESLEKVVLYDFNIWTSKTGKINELCFNPKIQSK